MFLDDHRPDLDTTRAGEERRKTIGLSGCQTSLARATTWRAWGKVCGSAGLKRKLRLGGQTSLHDLLR